MIVLCFLNYKWFKAFLDNDPDGSTREKALVLKRFNLAMGIIFVVLTGLALIVLIGGLAVMLGS